MGKISYSSMFKIVLMVTSLFLMGALLFVVPIESQPMHGMRILVAFGGVVCLLMVSATKHYKENLEYKFVKNYIVIVGVIIAFFTVYTFFLYDYPVKALLTLVSNYLYVCYSVPIIYTLLHERKERLWRTMLYIVIFFVIVRFIAWYSYNIRGTNILHNFVFEYSDWIRDGVHRLPGGTLFGLGFILLVYNLLNSKKKNPITKCFVLLCIVVLIIYCLIVTQSRYNTMVMIVTLVWSVLLTRKKTVSKFIFCSVLLLSIVALSVGGFLSDLFNSFSINGMYGTSTLARLEGLEHFSKLFFSKGHGIGLGFVANGYGTEELFYRTPELNFYMEDLGIMEIVLRFGVFSIGIYGYLFVKAYKVCVESCNNKNNYLSLILPTTIYMILSGLLSSLFITQNAFMVPFYVAIISYVDGRNKKGEYK